MARDIKLYQELGYELKKVQPVDLFPANAPRGVCSFARKSLEPLNERDNENALIVRLFRFMVGKY